MQSFKDSTGREWTIEINVFNLRKASEKFGFRIIKAVDDKPDRDVIDKLSDSDIFYDVVHAFITPECELDSFLIVCNSSTAYEAGKAFYLELANFSRPQSPGLNGMKLEKATELLRAMDKAATEETSKLTSESLLQMMKSSGVTSTDSSVTPASEQAT